MYSRFINYDIHFRQNYNRFEIWNRLNKSVEKTINFYDLSEPLLLKKKKIYSKAPIRNYCFETGRSYGVVPFFRISRMLVRKKAGIGLLTGVFKY
jgi:ribosomal protein S14